MACPVANLREYLAGTWLLTRSVEDRRRRMRGALRGQAVFKRTGDGLFLSETGHFRFGTYAGPTHCDYRYVFRTDDRADIQFPDGRPFCSISLRTGSCVAEHLCGRDRYHGRFMALAPDRLSIEWNAGGPEKDLAIRSCYRRA